MPRRSASTARSIDCKSTSAADRVCDCGEGVQWPKDKNPILFIAVSGTRQRTIRKAGHHWSNAPDASHLCREDFATEGTELRHRVHRGGNVGRNMYGNALQTRPLFPLSGEPATTLHVRSMECGGSTRVKLHWKAGRRAGSPKRRRAAVTPKLSLA